VPGRRGLGMSFHVYYGWRMTRDTTRATYPRGTLPRIQSEMEPKSDAPSWIKPIAGPDAGSGTAAEHDAMPAEPAFLGKDARYQAFLRVVAELRPRLHRYCTRMTGSALDGEDVVQEALFQAYRHLDEYDDTRPMAPWLMRIAHNRCLDLLRRRAVRLQGEGAYSVDADDAVAPEFDVPLQVPAALETLVLALPPKERACLLLKDVFDYSLEETAAVVDSTLAGVKAALHRGRAKLGDAHHTGRTTAAPSAEDLQLLHMYVDRFNRRDWNGVLELTRADARLEVADAFRGLLTASGYFSRYDTWSVPWRLAVGIVDDEAVVVRLVRSSEGHWRPSTATRVGVVDGRITEIRDYSHCPWLLPTADWTLVNLPTDPSIDPSADPSHDTPCA
jgi:RNA polymerase sigma-70 factor (ECF subfamily)